MATKTVSSFCCKNNAVVNLSLAILILEIGIILCSMHKLTLEVESLRQRARMLALP